MNTYYVLVHFAIIKLKKYLMSNKKINIIGVHDMIVIFYNSTILLIFYSLKTLYWSTQ